MAFRREWDRKWKEGQLAFDSERPCQILEPELAKTDPTRRWRVLRFLPDCLGLPCFFLSPGSEARNASKYPNLSLPSLPCLALPHYEYSYMTLLHSHIVPKLLAYCSSKEEDQVSPAQCPLAMTIPVPCR